jgi:phosphatidylserine decarboxylase
MKHSGKARKAGLKLILITLLLVVLVLVFGFFATAIGIVVAAVWPFVVALWMLFALFTLYFFRDPNPRIPAGTKLILAPAHGKVDVIDVTREIQFMGGECKRVSIFLSVVDVHVQNAPVSGKVAFSKYSQGQFLNALKVESASFNENLLLGFEASEVPGGKVGVRLIAGLIARRIVDFVKQGDVVQAGDRISLIQFGSRADVYLPLTANIKVNLGDRVVGGVTVLASFE